MTNAELSAFPYLDNSGGSLFCREAGITKRELFAAMAMQGLLATHRDIQHNEVNVAHWAVKNADALLTALEKELS